MSKTISNFLLNNPRLSIVKDGNKTNPYTTKYTVGDINWTKDEIDKKGLIMTFHREVMENASEEILNLIIYTWLDSLKDDNEENKD